MISPLDFKAPLCTATDTEILKLRFIRRRIPRFCKFPCKAYFMVFFSNVNNPPRKKVLSILLMASLKSFAFKKCRRRFVLASSTTPRGLRQNKHGLLGKDPHRFPSCGPSRPRGPISLWAASCFAYSRSNNRASSP